MTPTSECGRTPSLAPTTLPNESAVPTGITVEEEGSEYLGMAPASGTLTGCYDLSRPPLAHLVECPLPRVCTLPMSSHADDLPQVTSLDDVEKSVEVTQLTLAIPINHFRLYSSCCPYPYSGPT